MKKSFLFTVVALLTLTGCTTTGESGQVTPPGPSTTDVTSITLNETSKELTVNETFQLVATVNPSDATDRTITWKSSNTDIVTVSNSGIVSAIKEGNATVTVTSNSNKNVTASCSFTVKGSDPVDDEVTEKYNFTTKNWNATEGNWTSGKSGAGFSNGGVQITTSYTGAYAISPKEYSGVRSVVVEYCTNSRNGNGTVEISVGNDSIGSQSITKNGGITARELTFTSNGTLNGKVKITVNVTTNSVYIKSITINAGTPKPIDPTAIFVDSTMELGQGASKTLNVTYSPSNANQNKEVDFSSSNTNVATVDDYGKVTAKSTAAFGSTAVVTARLEKFPSITATCTVTVIDTTVRVTGVSLNKATADVSINGTVNLSATVSPSDATNKNVSWSTSNSSIAAVANGVVTGKSVGEATITATTEDGGKTASCKVTVKEVTADKWTIMIYMCGADLESGSDEYGRTNPNSAGYATADLTEILSISGQPDDINVIVETGGALAWNSKYGISASKLGRWHVSNKKLVKDAELTYSSMGLQSTFESFLKWGLESYPAEKTGVILWNHGGAMTGVCFDEKKNSDSLTNAEIQSACSNVLKNGQKLEFIGYDACLMGVQDIAITNSKYFNYMVGAEESEAGSGWDYDSWIDDLYANKSTEEVLKAICDGFIAQTNKEYKENNWGDSDQTLAFYELSYAEEYKNNWEAMATKMSAAVKTMGKSKFRDFMIKNVKSYADDVFTKQDLAEYASYYQCSQQDIINEYGLTLQDDGKYHSFYGAYNYGVFDARDFVNEAKKNSNFSSLTSELTAVGASFDKLVKYSATGAGAGDSYGMTMFYAGGSGCSKGTYYTKSHTDLTNWISFNSSYGY